LHRSGFSPELAKARRITFLSDTLSLPEEMFMRVHRSFIVDLEKINTIERSRIVFGKEYIPVSDQYKARFQEFPDKNFL
jgi:DNA-binding LytR/AlgR family response regulator